MKAPRLALQPGEVPEIAKLHISQQKVLPLDPDYAAREELRKKRFEKEFKRSYLLNKILVWIGARPKKEKT